MSTDRLLRSHLKATGLVLLLGLAGSGWLVAGMIAPQVVQAYTARVDVELDRLPNESYEALIRRAEVVARAAAQRSFDRDILASEVSVIVIGRNQGSEAPILTLDVSRRQWRDRPDTRRWAIYFKTSAALLGFDSLAPAPINVPVQPTPTPVPSPPARPQSPTPPSVTPNNAPGTNQAPAQDLSPDSPSEDEDEVPPEDRDQ
jgi:hypothetical protein